MYARRHTKVLVRFDQYNNKFVFYDNYANCNCNFAVKGKLKRD